MKHAKPLKHLNRWLRSSWPPYNVTVIPRLATPRHHNYQIALDDIILHCISGKCREFMSICYYTSWSTSTSTRRLVMNRNSVTKHHSRKEIRMHFLSKERQPFYCVISCMVSSAILASLKILIHLSFLGIWWSYFGARHTWRGILQG